MESPQKPGPWYFRHFLAPKLPEAMEQRVNEDHISIQTVDSRRNDQVEPEFMDPAIPRAADRIQAKPRGKLQKLRAGKGRNLVPEERAGILRPLLRGRIKVEVLDAPGVEMDFTMHPAREPFEQFGERAFRSVVAIDKG